MLLLLNQAATQLLVEQGYHLSYCPNFRGRLSGWWPLLGLVPLINVIFQLYLLFSQGEEGINRFGPPPNGQGKLPAPAISLYSKANKEDAPKTQKQMLSDDVFYERIGIELESNDVDKAVWTRAFAMAEGDDKKTRVSYINLRFKKLKSDFLSKEPDTSPASGNVNDGEDHVRHHTVSSELPAPKHKAQFDSNNPPPPSTIEKITFVILLALLLGAVVFFLFNPKA